LVRDKRLALFLRIFQETRENTKSLPKGEILLQMINNTLDNGKIDARVRQTNPKAYSLAEKE
jgi:hypothetical protein